MTAEVALMNKLAVALAADSAVTVSTRNRQKVYNGGNKLFALSKYSPVGIMVYGNAEFMGLPWETIIKVYRDQLGELRLGTIDEYFRHFLAFLGNNDDLFGDDTQLAHVLTQAAAYYLFLKKRVTESIEALMTAQGSLTEDQVKPLVSKVITAELERWRAYTYSPDMDDGHRDEVARRYTSTLEDALKAALQQLPLSDDDHKHLIEIGTYLFSKDFLPASSAGVVVAGFGESQHFPSLRAAQVEARIAGRLKYRQSETADISHDVGAVIVPFAQSDVVGLFIEGVDPTYETLATAYFKQVFLDFPKHIAATLDTTSDETRASFTNKWQRIGRDLLTDCQHRLKQELQIRYVDPMLDVVEAMPKSELASLAEALVNLTSLKRKVSLDVETVGGPVDVAVISKGDGLIWIQRKHYFKSELNHQFFANYFD